MAGQREITAVRLVVEHKPSGKLAALIEFIGRSGNVSALADPVARETGAGILWLLAGAVSTA